MEKLSFDLSRCAPDPQRPRIGLLCSYTPEEVILAAGLQPFKLRMTGKPLQRADAYLHNTLCAYVRSILEGALEGEAEGLSGMLFVNSCDAMRRLCDVWRHYLPTGFVHLLDLPRESTPEKVAFYARQLRELGAALAGAFQVEVSSESLSQAIRQVNRTRRLLSELASLAQGPNAPLEASQLLSLSLMAQASDRGRFNRLLEDLLEQARKPTGEVSRRTDPRPRVLLTGSVIDGPEIMSFMEDLGLRVVAADLCTAQRGLDHPVEEEGDPWEALARRYLLRAPCARMKGLEQRMGFIRKLMAGHQVAGVVSYTLKFCDPELMFYPLLKQELEAQGVPHVHLEGDGTLGSFGQMKTRIQAFTEMLRA